MEKRYKICGIATKALGIKWFMLENLKYVGNHGFESYIVCEHDSMFEDGSIGNVKYIPIDLKRGYSSPYQVIKAIVSYCHLFRKEHFDIIQYTSSNAALFASIAGWITKVPVRIYCQWGMAYTEYKGFKRFFYRTAAKLTCFFSTNVQPDSFANLKYAIEDNLYPSYKGSVVYKGSACGVDMEKFNIRNKAEWRKTIRREFGIESDVYVFGFVGRLVKDKGLNELFEAFLSIKDSNSILLVVGPNYEIESLNQELYKKALANKRIVFVGKVDDIEEYYAAMDFLVLPSYREGFGSVIIEAAALAVPSICSGIKGPTDFVKHGVNGFVCEVKSAESLEEAMRKALDLTDFEYQQLSENAYSKVKDDFDAAIFKQFFLKDRISLIENWQTKHK